MELRQRTKQKKKPLIFLKEWHVHFKGGSPFLYLGEFNESGYALVVYDLKRKTFSSYRYGMQTFISKEEDDIIKWEDWIKENPFSVMIKEESGARASMDLYDLEEFLDEADKEVSNAE